MNIEFQKEKDKYVGYAQIEDVCALHVVRENSGRFEVQQSHVKDDNYAPIPDYTNSNYSKTIDVTIDDRVFPLYLRFVSESKVTSAKIVQ